MVFDSHRRIRFAILISFTFLLFIHFSNSYTGDLWAKDRSYLPKDWEYKGIAISGYTRNAFDSVYLKPILLHYKRLGFNAIELTPSYYQENLNSHTIERVEKRTINDHDLEKLITLSKKSDLNFKINLKPHLEPFGEGMPIIEYSRYQEMMDELKIERPDDAKKIKECFMELDADDLLEKRFQMKASLAPHKKKMCDDIIAGYPFKEYWRARVKPPKAQLKKWFIAYEKFLMHYLDLAVKNNVELFTVGTELISMTRPEKELLEEWKSLMKNLRAEAERLAADYHTAVPVFLYAAHEHEVFGVPTIDRHWNEPEKNCDIHQEETGSFDIGNPWEKNKTQNEKKKICRHWIKTPDKENQNMILKEFWSLFDAISLTVYYELGHEKSDKINAITVLETKEKKSGDASSFEIKTKQQINCLESWITALGLPDEKSQVIIGELGYRSVEYGHIKPFETKGPIFDFTEDRNNNTNQELAYSAMLKALSGRKWLKGVFVWQEEIGIPMNYLNHDNTDYSILGKPASRVFEKNFKGIEQAPLRQPSNVIFHPEFAGNYDVMTGAGFGDGDSNSEQWYFWTKFRARPVHIGFADKRLHSIDLGLWYSATFGGGDLPVYQSEYDWKRHLIGPTVKFSGNSWSLDFDFGIGTIKEDSHSEINSYRSDQKDSLVYGFIHFDYTGRRYDDYIWFPATAIDLELTEPFESDQTRSLAGVTLPEEKYDRSRLELSVTQGIMDWSLGKNWRLTPNLEFKYGYESGDDNFYDFGAGLTLGHTKETTGHDILRLTIFKENGARENSVKGVVYFDILALFDD